MRVLSIISLAVIFSSCNVSNSSFADAEDWVPSTFNPKNDYLLVETFPMSQNANEEMRQFLTQNYPGRFEIVSEKTIKEKSGKYADTKAYKFAFLWDEQTAFYTGNSSSSGRREYANGNFYDRANDKAYPTTQKYNNYGRKSYIPFFNSIIKVTGKR